MLALTMPRRRARRALNPRRAVGYVRTSTGRQEISPEVQRDLLERWAEEHDVELVAVHQDIGLSGGADLEDAPGLQEALAGLEERNAGILLAVHRDRLARGMLRAALVDALAERAGGRVLTVEDDLEEDGEDALLRRGFKDLFAAYERQRIRTRTRSALRKLRADNVQMGRAPYGWRWSGSEDVDKAGRQRLIEDVEEQATIRIIRRLRAKKLTLRAIGDALEAKGRHPRGHTDEKPRRWHPSTLAQVLGYQPPSVKPVGLVRGRAPRVGTRSSGTGKGAR